MIHNIYPIGNPVTAQPEICMNEEQQRAIDIILSKEHHFVFLTGGDGTGKTTVIKELKRQLDSAHRLDKLPLWRENNKNEECHHNK